MMRPLMVLLDHQALEPCRAWLQPFIWFPAERNKKYNLLIAYGLFIYLRLDMELKYISLFSGFK